MEYYKVLLVDDEEDVRRAIVRKMDWRSLGFELAGEAGNGEEALELAERLEPDVVMTDIKMPFMDGLELCRRIKQLLPGVRVAVFSGFDEFEYAKEAITQQVEEYILKPIDAGELAAVFRRMRQSLDAEIAQRRDLERLRRHYEESAPLMRQQLLSGLLDGHTPPEVIANKLAGYGLNVTAAVYCVAVVRHEPEDGAKEETHLLSISLGQLIEETLSPEIQYHLVQMPDQIALLFLLEAGSEPRQVMDLLGRLFPTAKRLLGLRLSVGVGGLCTRLDEIPRCYDEACSALEYQLLMEPGQCIYIGDIEPGAATPESPDGKYTEEVLRQIKVGQREDLEIAVQDLILHLKKVHTGIQQYQIYFLELFTELLKLIRTYRMDEKEARQDSLLLEGVSLQFATLDELGHWLLDYCDNLRLLARRERKDSVRILTDRAKTLIVENFADSTLSLDTVCKSLGVSPAYFSTVFKRETEKGFVGYLTDLRMEKAQELLVTTDDKTYQIAEKTGYTDPNYFSYVFKKQLGVSPSKYKADRMIENGPSEISLG